MRAAPLSSGSEGGDPSDPTSPLKIPSFDPSEPESPTPFHPPPFPTLEGPRLEDDPPNALYDNFADPWGSSADLPVRDDDYEGLNFSTQSSSYAAFEAANDPEAVESAREARIHSDIVYGHPRDPQVGERPRTAPSTIQNDNTSTSLPSLHTYEPDPNALHEPQRVLHPDDWWPWPDAATATATQLSAFPRSLFSERDMDTAVWLARQCGADISYSVRQLNACRDKISQSLGPCTESHKGAHGNPFTMLDFGKIIADEWANPCVRPHIRTYAEDAGEKLSAPYNALKWKEEVNAALSGPMVRAKDGRDYYVEEPALILHESGARAVMPLHWFKRDNFLWGRVQALTTVSVGPSKALAIDARVDCFEVPLSAFLASYEDLRQTHDLYGLPEPSRIVGEYERHLAGVIEPDGVFRDELITAPNPIRVQAAGKRVYTPPVWAYCDDTSGNSSKKWNKHNSLLFTLAGLPPDLVHLMYNIHFLATSNVAAPLEMFEALVNKLKEIREQGGIEVYDCVHGEVVLLLPWIIGMNGDNPMQSEFSSHIGLQGKCYCRVCHARNDNKSRKKGDDVESERLDSFMFVQEGSMRTKEDTVRELERQLDAVLDGAPTRATNHQTDTGVKDRYFAHFEEVLAEECSRIKERQQAGDNMVDLKSALRRLRDSMPKDIFNPALRLDGFDPCQDTPVEILHVILLGFVKYFWRDAVSRLTKEEKDILKARIDSFDVNGLNIPSPRGHLLVHYAGSLTGRDFRVILQLAPSILLGLIPDEAYDAWLALCRLAPLAFQPEIENKTEYLKRLEFAVQDFLAYTAMWTTQWFNKPKFHILLHITEHSYNFVIRLRSIHSSRHAPSADIGASFARMHTIRHLVSGGFVQDASQHGNTVWRQAGQRITDFPTDPLYAKLMGMADFMFPPSPGSFEAESRCPRVSWTDTQSAASGHPCPLPEEDLAVRFCRSATLTSKDDASVGGYVLVRLSSEGSIRVARVVEIIAGGQPERVLGLLLQLHTVGNPMQPYGFPSLRCEQANSLVWVSLDMCIATVGTIHNCHAHQCRVAPVRVQKKERQEMEERGLGIIHDSPEDLLINLALIRLTAEKRGNHI
ncbi:hypothetical protein GGG16DRAFT_67955 [Schizophyllum commune]